MQAVTPQQMKQLEKSTDESGTSYLEMMENAGTRLADVILEMTGDKDFPKVLFLCGSGNNGGDCFVAARLLSRRGIDCTTALVSGTPKNDGIAWRNYQLLGRNVCILHGIDKAVCYIKNDDFDVIVDGVFGTGFHGELPSDIIELFEECSRSSAHIIAADVPSGGNCLTGAVSEGTPEAYATVTFGNIKFGMTQYPLKEHCGIITVAPIGIPDAAYEDLTRHYIDVAAKNTVKYSMPQKAPDINKGDNGRLLIIAGSRQMPGACIMAAEGALRSGAGLVQVASVGSVLNALSYRDPEVMQYPLKEDENGFISEDNYDSVMKLSQKADAVLIGCGMGTEEGTKRLVKRLIKDIRCPKIVDADGINCIADSIDIIKSAGDSLILTPHPGEMGRLLNKSAREVQTDRLEAVTELCENTSAVVVLKGAGTLTACKHEHEGKVHITVNTTGNAGMAKGGSGDVLAGIIGGLITVS